MKSIREFFRKIFGKPVEVEKTASARIHPRVNLELESILLRDMLGAEAKWPNNEMSLVYDMSYGGAALQVPDNLKVEKGQDFLMRFDFPKGEWGPIRSTIIWNSSEKVGLKFDESQGAMRLTLNQFLDDKLVGRNLHKVSEAFFSPDLDCSAWFHGPNSTNVFLWLDQEPAIKKVNKIRIQWAGHTIDYDRSLLRFEFSRKNDEKEQFQFTLADSIKMNEEQRLWLNKSLNLLSQIREFKTPLADVLTEWATLLK